MKHMKKSMFITTVMMVVLLVVAVSTATFAWYTSSNTVNTAATNVNSAESTGANIAIGWVQNAPVGSSQLTFVAQSTDFLPMIPLLVDKGTSSAFTSDTIFYTANISGTSLTSHSNSDPYIGAQTEGGNTTFYVINYSRLATKINFSTNVTGENAARLRVAVFNATTKALVYVNKIYYTGELIDTVPESYTLQEEKPSDWADNYFKYSTSSGSFNAVVAVAPTWQNNTYYKNGEVVNVAEGQPADWAAGYSAYTTADKITPVAGVAPAWTTDTYYTFTPAIPIHLVSSIEAASVVDLDVNIAASTDGVTGVAQGFIVKAWFDGPTQVDAYGGLDANFTLTAQVVS